MKAHNVRQLVSCGLVLGLVGLATTGCPPPSTNPPDNEPKVADGIFAEMGEPMPLATAQQRETFQRGRRVALRRFSLGEGLGPSFNTTFCASCHENPTTGGSSPRYRNFYLVADDRESFVMIDEPPSKPHTDRPGDYEAPKPKTAKSGVQLRYRDGKPYRNRTPDNARVVVHRNGIPFFGVGALAQISLEEILKREDPKDRDNDGISGRPNVGDLGAIGRFGRKAQTGSLEGFVRGPLFNHVGITSNPLTPEMRRRLPFADNATTIQRGALRERSQAQVATSDEPLEDSDGVEDPELPTEDLFDLVSFVRLLAAPEPTPLDDRAKHGEELFDSIGCADCHVPALKGPNGLIPAYTDLLLHDMGEKLADGFAQADAKGSEFRTQPLWGLAATDPYLHDGRAATVDEAIRWHGGEGDRARKNYEDLSEQDREDLLAFLETLGGAEQDSQGLIPPDDPVPEAGEFDGPVAGLTKRERELFERGRRLFDRDTTVEEGLGPKFNGDSCRACHFDPTTGGAGPAGLSVTREGRLTPEGTFEAPPGGTLLHRFTTDFTRRPRAHGDSNVFELRQPPALFGLGLVDDISEEAIESHADPNDSDGDGVSGRVSRPIQGSVGKFGWKGAFPTLQDFVRDALTNEMGLTVPDRPGVFAGRRTDGDGASDPEFAGQRYDALVFYVENLAPPPRPDKIGTEAKAGEKLFRHVGCAECHVPKMETESGEEVALYSDLLLHEVAPKDYRGVGEAGAGPREFRTPPLWGISETAPYMHDGLAGTIDEAIRRHAAEAAPTVERYEALSDEERQTLLAFLNSL